MTQSWETPKAPATVSNSWDTPGASVAVSNSWDTPAPSVLDNSWDVPATTQAGSWDEPLPTTQTSSWDAPSSRPMATSVGQTRSRSQPSSQLTQSFQAHPAHQRSDVALDSGPQPGMSQLLCAASNISNMGTGVSGASLNTPAFAASDSWERPVNVQSKSWDIPAASASWDAPVSIAQSQAHADRSASQTSVPPNDGSATSTNSAIHPSEEQRSGDNHAITSADMPWDTPAPAVANDSWDAPTPARAADSSDRPATQAVSSWGAPDSSVSEPKHLSWDQPEGLPEGTSSRNPYESGRHDSRPARLRSMPNHEYSVGSTSSVTSKTTAIGLGASRWAPTNRPQRARYEGQRRRYEDEGGSRRGYGGGYSGRDRNDNYGQESGSKGSWTGKDQGNIDTSGDNGSWPVPNASGNINSDRPELAATPSNDWDAAPVAALTNDWEAVPVLPSDNWESTPTPVVAGNNRNRPDQRQDVKSVTPQAAKHPKATADTAASTSADSWDATAPAVLDSWDAPTPTVNSWDAPALGVGYSQDAALAPVKEEAFAPALSAPAQTESKRDNSWAAATVFVPKSWSAPESPTNAVPASAPSTEYAGWDTPVPVPDNSWDATPATASNGNTSPPAPRQIRSNAEPMNALAPALHGPEPPQSEPKFESRPAIRAQDQSSQPSQSSWDTPALAVADNSWDMPTSAAASGWDATPVTTAQKTGWDARNPADSRPLARDSWSQSQSQGYAHNGSGAPTEGHFRGGGLAGSKYSNGGGSYSGDSRGGRRGYDRRGGYVDDKSDFGGGYGHRGGYGGKGGNHQENDRPSTRDDTKNGGDGGPPRSIHGNGTQNTDRPFRDYDANSAAQSWDATTTQEFSEQRSWGSQVTGTAESWNTAPVAAAETWDGPAAAGATKETSIALAAPAAAPPPPPPPSQKLTAGENCRTAAAGRTSPTSPSAVMVQPTPKGWDGSVSDQQNDSWHIQQPMNSW
ncbi:uncharacterized protein V1513DRAFT_449534 [Lipomyces chichibuensis]|uniref:uncharacterized protein n=1 Tax=Lipomyces chichibuensis TaxID=1546026 RepID=UPI003343A540